MKITRQIVGRDRNLAALSSKILTGHVFHLVLTSQSLVAKDSKNSYYRYKFD